MAHFSSKKSVRATDRSLFDMPSQLYFGPIHLRFERYVSVSPEGGRVPYYHFKIHDAKETIVGHINFRIGDTRHIRMCVGHIGYGILPEHRGRSFAYYACRALRPFVREFYDDIVMTANPGNLASIRIIEKLGARFIEEITVPEDDPAYAGGARIKRRYEWIL